jgi:hypothetical protein
MSRTVIFIPDMDNQFWDGMSIIKEILAAMNRTGKSQGEILNFS